MDDRRFDSLTRLIGRGASRRTVLRSLLGLGAVSATGSLSADGADARTARTRPTLAPPPPPSCPLPKQMCGGMCCDEGKCKDGHCCPNTFDVWCDNDCCGSGICTDDGATCCAAGDKVCGTLCCPAHTSCAIDGNQDLCCDPAAGGFSCGLECCETEAQCCDRECCQSGSVCVSEETCCPEDRACEAGSTPCCAEGQDCCADSGCCDGTCYLDPNVQLEICCPRGNFCAITGECCDSGWNCCADEGCCLGHCFHDESGSELCCPAGFATVCGNECCSNGTHACCQAADGSLSCVAGGCATTTTTSPSACNPGCPTGEVCCGGACVSGACCTGADCAASPSDDLCWVCTAERQCIEATDDTACASGGSTCCHGVCLDAGAPCLCVVNDHCAPGEICCGGACVTAVCCEGTGIGCLSDEVCCGGACVAGSCCTGADCAASSSDDLCWVCTAERQCIEAADGTACASGGSTCCHGVCLDAGAPCLCVVNDHCAPGEICCGGACVTAVCCEGTGIGCLSDEVCCGGACVSGACCTGADCAASPSDDLCWVCTAERQCIEAADDTACASGGSTCCHGVCHDAGAPCLCVTNDHCDTNEICCEGTCQTCCAGTGIGCEEFENSICCFGDYCRTAGNICCRIDGDCPTGSVCCGGTCDIGECCTGIADDFRCNPEICCPGTNGNECVTGPNCPATPSTTTQQPAITTTQIPTTASPPTSTTCPPDCTGKTCGDDGCGGSCGTCANFPNSFCNATTGACDCTPTSITCPQGINSQTSDGCGGTIICPGCTLNGNCVNFGFGNYHQCLVCDNGWCFGLNNTQCQVGSEFGTCTEGNCSIVT